MPIFLSIIRHLLTLCAGGLITVGVSEKEVSGLVQAAEPVVAGALLYGSAQIWSLVEKKKKR
jgi:hypothetical protein